MVDAILELLKRRGKLIIDRLNPDVIEDRVEDKEKKITVKEIHEWFLKNRSERFVSYKVVADAISEGVKEGIFGYADRLEEVDGRYKAIIGKYVNINWEGWVISKDLIYTQVTQEGSFEQGVSIKYAEKKDYTYTHAYEPLDEYRYRYNIRSSNVKDVLKVLDTINIITVGKDAKKRLDVSLSDDDTIKIESRLKNITEIKSMLNQLKDRYNKNVLISIEIKTKEDISNELNKYEVNYERVMLCKHIDFNSLGIRWLVTHETIGNTLSMRRPSIIYNFAETNPFEKSSGTLQGMLDNIVNAIKFASRNSKNNNTNIILGSALHLPYSNEFDLIITDPPYLDDVAYGEISEFFYVWLYRALKDYYPELPARVPLDEDIVLSKHKFDGNEELAYSFYLNALKESFKNIHKALKDDGLAVIFFAHSSVEAWNLLDVLRETKIQVMQYRQSVENVLARNKASFMSSIAIACRKIHDNREAYIEDLIPRIEDRIEELLKGIDNNRLLLIPITDLLIMIYGKVLEVATAYTRLKRYSSNNVDLKDILEDATDYMMRALIRKLVERDANILGKEISFYIIAKVFYHGVMQADDELHLRRVFNIDKRELSSIASSKKGLIRLLSFKEVNLNNRSVDEIDPKDIHEQLMYIMHKASEEGG